MLLTNTHIFMKLIKRYGYEEKFLSPLNKNNDGYNCYKKKGMMVTITLKIRPKFALLAKKISSTI